MSHRKTDASTVDMLREQLAHYEEIDGDACEISPASAEIIARDLEDLHRRRAEDLSEDEVQELKALNRGLGGASLLGRIINVARRRLEDK